MISGCPPLDLNSCYAYLLLCRDFASTCAVAENSGRMAAFVSAYIPPERPDALFVWQVAVDREFRGNRLAGKLIRGILDRPACAAVRFLETTVSPSNAPSRALFKSLAASLPASLREQPGFDAARFGPEDHEEEVLYSIGPFNLHPEEIRETQ